MSTKNEQDEAAKAAAAAKAEADAKAGAAAKAEADAKAAAAAKAAGLKVGDTATLRAVHGFIQNPNDLTVFTVDQPKKVTVDEWTRIQFEAGKLAHFD